VSHETVLSWLLAQQEAPAGQRLRVGKLRVVMKLLATAERGAGTALRHLA
jgi:hypothetical protein